MGKDLRLTAPSDFVKRSNRRVETPQIAVATLDAKAYYTLTSLLKELNLSFSSITPSELPDIGVRLVLTTRQEKRLLRAGEIICLEDIAGDASVAKEEIFSILYQRSEDILLIGIDPGERTGIAVYYREKEMAEEITQSIEETLLKVGAFVRGSRAEEMIIRIGDGKPQMARHIARRLVREFKNKVEVEIVDERGTSTITNLDRTGELRDLRSARLISLRHGRRYRYV
jgi:RNase H-fold protein (predicted Holliday junction resolvase)